MANKILLCISSTQTVAAYWQGGQLVRCATFAPDETGIEAFTAFLQTTGSALTYVAADSVEEDYRFDILPHATGADRAALLDRKIRQFYRSTRFVSAQHRGRTTDKRHDDRYLFAALTNPTLIDPWLAALAQHGTPIAGVYLTSMLSGALLRKLNRTESRVLIAAPHQSGLRLTFYKDGAFCSSRLTRPIPKAPNDAAQMLVTELLNTRSYLSTLNLDTLDEPLSVVFLDRDNSLSAVVKHISADGHGLNCTSIGRDALTRQLQVSQQHLDIALETIYLRLMAENPAAPNLAPASITAGYRQQQKKQALYVASAAVALVGVLWSGINLWRTYDLTLETQEAARRTSAAQLQYKEITRTFPAAPTHADNLVKAVSLYQQVVKSARSPQRLMQVVSRAIERSPEIQVQELQWVYGAPSTVPAKSAASTPATVSERLRQSGVLTGEIKPFQGDFRAAIESINLIALRLASDPLVADVKILKLPLNVSPELALSGNTRDASEHTGAAEFKIQFSFKPSK